MRNLSAFELTHRNRARRAELSSGKKNTVAVGARKTQRVYSAPPGAVESPLAQLHREEKPAGVELTLAYTEETPMEGKGQSAALTTERKVLRRSNAPSVSSITNIYF